MGGLVSVPLAWLLSYGAALPFFLGLFFFALFGLVIGASVFRVASRGGRYSRGRIELGTALLVLWGMWLSIVFESRGFPEDKAREAAQSTLDIGHRTRAEYEAFVAEQVRDYLRKHYPPGGTVGYVRWVVASGEIPRGDLKEVRRTLQIGHHGWTWVIRVLLSTGLLAFGIGSQLWGLIEPTQTPATTSEAPLQKT
ncbi:MAG: hypothetical protein D6788_11155 [Planctomycetota bacterium]|nr:MAG: hypothetical protein D6788_11155 [Planctomycetota bacterium]